MEFQPSSLTLGLLPQPQTRWNQFVVSYGVQSLIVVGILVAAIAYPDVLEIPDHDYHFVWLVDTPPPVPQAPQPVKHLPVPTPKIEAVAPRPEAMRVPSEIVRKKAATPEEKAPDVTLAAKKEMLPDAKVVIPRAPVKTNVFTTGSSSTPTIVANPTKVQTGGFGDPNGLPAQDSHAHPVTIAQAGSFDMPNGMGSGNGTGGSRGAKGVVASTGFGNGVATGTGNGGVSASRTVSQGGFGDASIATASSGNRTMAAAGPRTLPAEITYKPRPVYTDEGRQLKIEGEVLIDVVFAANGQIRIVRVVRGLGHGLDESAVKAAQKIQFKPAIKDGQPTDFEGVLHIVFELAS